eukprot:g3747.t1
METDPFALRKTRGGHLHHHSPSSASTPNKKKNASSTSSSAAAGKAASSLAAYPTSGSFKRRAPTKFVKSLFTLVNTSPSHIVDWDTNGLSFQVKDTELFAAQILPQYFKSARMPSFYRQLQFYNFSREFIKDPVTPPGGGNSGGGKGREKTSPPSSSTGVAFKKRVIISHPFFVRNRFDLLGFIQRVVPVDKTMKKEIEELREKVASLEHTCAYLDSHRSILSEKLDKVWGIVQVMAQRTPGVLQVLKRDVFRDFRRNSSSSAPTRPKRLRMETPSISAEADMAALLITQSGSSTSGGDDRAPSFRGDVRRLSSAATTSSVPPVAIHETSRKKSDPLLSPIRLFDRRHSEMVDNTTTASTTTVAASANRSSTPAIGIDKTISPLPIGRDEDDTVIKTLSSMSLQGDDAGLPRTTSMMSTEAIDDYSELVRLLSFEIPGAGSV